VDTHSFHVTPVPDFNTLGFQLEAHSASAYSHYYSKLREDTRAILNLASALKLLAQVIDLIYFSQLKLLTYYLIDSVFAN
jgi:hypothetical protein